LTHTSTRRQGWTDISADGQDRKSFAGYENNPGTIVYRGRDMGETSIVINSNGYNEIKVTGFNAPTPGERDFITVAIIPGLLKAIKENKRELKAEAVEAVKNRIIEHVKEARAEIDKLEAEALEAVKKLQ